MAHSKLPLLGGAEIVDLQQRVKDKQTRELLARIVAERNQALDHMEQLGRALLGATELLAECRGCMQEASGADSYAELIAKITELLGE